MHGFKIVHVLINELCNRDFCQITMSFISDQPHRENVAQCRGNQMRVFTDEQLEPGRKILVCFLMIHWPGGFEISGDGLAETAGASADGPASVGAMAGEAMGAAAAALEISISL